MRFHLNLSKPNFRIPNPFRRREAPPPPEASGSGFRVLGTRRDQQGIDAPEGWIAPREPQTLRVTNPDRISPEPPLPSIEVQEPTPLTSPTSPTRPPMERQSSGSSGSSIGDYNPQWVYHAGAAPLTNAQPHGSLHVMNGSPSSSGSSSPERPSSHGSRSPSPETPSAHADRFEGFDPRAFPPPGGFRPLARQTAIRLQPEEGGARRLAALGRSIERPSAPGPDHVRNRPTSPAPSPEGSDGDGIGIAL